MSEVTSQQSQEAYMQLQMMQQQLQSLHQQKGSFEQQIQDLAKLKEQVLAMKDVKEKSPMFAPLGQGIYLKTVVDNTSQLLVNIGAGVLIERSVEESITMVDSQMDTVKKAIAVVDKDIGKMSAQFNKLQQKMMQEAGQQQAPQ